MAAVFAQLETPTADGTVERHGVHCFLVPLRDAKGRDLPGVTTSDCGHKGGLRGVDNGRIMFDQVRIARENLLNKYGDVAEDGTYTSPVENINRRFFTMLGTLVRGSGQRWRFSQRRRRGGADDRRQVRPDAAPVRSQSRSGRSSSWTTGRTNGGCCR